MVAAAVLTAVGAAAVGCGEDGNKDGEGGGGNDDDNDNGGDGGSNDGRNIRHTAIS